MSAQRRAPTAVEANERLRAAYRDVAAFLEPRVEGIVADVNDLLREQIPVYGAEAPGTLRPNIRAILDIALHELRQGRGPDATDAEAITTLARRWASEGRPLDQRSFQLGARRVAVTVARHAAELNLDDHALFAMQGAVWDWATMCAAILADAQRDHEVAAARRDAAHRANFLRDLAAGGITAERLTQEAEALGLDVDQPYFAVRAQCANATSAAMLEVHIRRSGATEDRHALQVVLGDRLLAVVPQVPAEYEGVKLAVGPATLLQEANASFAEAAEALATAQAFGINGVVDLGTLGPLPLVTQGDTLAERLSERHFRELDARGPSGLELEETVRALLDKDRNIEATASELHLHRNSIRYRVRRFCELTGLDLRRTEDLVTAWWLLKRRQAARATGR